MVVDCGPGFKLALATGEERFGFLSPVCGHCPFRIVKSTCCQHEFYLSKLGGRMFHPARSSAELSSNRVCFTCGGALSANSTYTESDNLSGKIARHLPGPIVDLYKIAAKPEARTSSARTWLRAGNPNCAGSSLQFCRRTAS